MPIFGNELTYNLKLVALDKGQSPTDAIYRNLPLLEKYRVRGLSMPYPVTAMPLKEGQKYAWQVTAFWGNTEIGKTEIWAFSLEKPKPIAQINRQESYRLVKQELGSSFYIFSNEIYFAFQNQGYEATLNYSIYSKENPKKKVNNLPNFVKTI